MSKGAYSPMYADIFSLGVVLLVIVNQRSPFTRCSSISSKFKLLKANTHKKLWKIQQKERQTRGLEVLSAEFQDLVSSLLESNPLYRPSLSEIKAHPWYKGSVPSESKIKEEFERREQLLASQSFEEECSIRFTDSAPRISSLRSSILSNSTMSSENSGSECDSPTESL